MVSPSSDRAKPLTSADEGQSRGTLTAVGKMQIISSKISELPSEFFGLVWGPRLFSNSSPDSPSVDRLEKLGGGVEIRTEKAGKG